MVFKKNKQRQRRPGVSTSGKVPLTYYRSRPSEDGSSPFEKKQSRPSRLRRGTLILIDIVLVVLLLAALIYSLLLKPTPNIVASGRDYHDSGVYRQVAIGQLSSIQNRSKLTINEAKIITALQAKFPEITGVNIELPIFSQNPTIRLTISPPGFFLNSSSQTYVVDEQGTAVSKQDKLPRIASLPQVIDQSGFEATAGKQVLNSNGAVFIKALVKQCQLAKVPVQSLTLPAQAQELDLRTADHSYYTKFFLGDDAAQEIGQFLAARHQFDSTNSQPSEYLDVRVPGKVFYK